MDRRQLLALPLVAIGVSIADSASACAIALPLYHRVNQPADVIVAGAVAWTHPDGEPGQEYQLWSGRIWVQGVALGAPDAEAYPIQSGSFCGAHFPQPQVGDLWVAYLCSSGNAKGGLVVNYSAPLLGARRLDPRLKALKWRSR